MSGSSSGRTSRRRSAWSTPTPTAKKKAARMAMLASRFNTMLSIPMLYCMVSAQCRSRVAPRIERGQATAPFLVGVSIDGDEGRRHAAALGHQDVVGPAGSAGIHRLSMTTPTVAQRLAHPRRNRRHARSRSRRAADRSCPRERPRRPRRGRRASSMRCRRPARPTVRSVNTRMEPSNTRPLTRNRPPP